MFVTHASGSPNARCMSSVLSQYIVLCMMPPMLPGLCPSIDVSVDDVMLVFLAHIHLSSAVHTADHCPLDTFLYCLLPRLVFVMLLTTWLELILTQPI